ncbi:Transcriptional repressor rco-1 [Smittium mucronatum]|uniref:Transcriptional repressor rco-1 n=1 Tax=Smittium mucronatum TaxID=133383 RepID=A0A1R0H7R8_9FUNG|nr:Transcriptional repressor rco-1 [Smittium mucronatum]
MIPSAPISNRVSELLDALKTEFEATSQDAAQYKFHKDEIEQRVNSQITEMTAFKQSLIELERTHQSIKQQYEDEIYRLRRELEARGGPPASQGPFLPLGNLSGQSGLGMPGIPLGQTRTSQNLTNQAPTHPNAHPSSIGMGNNVNPQQPGADIPNNPHNPNPIPIGQGNSIYTNGAIPGPGIMSSGGHGAQQNPSVQNNNQIAPPNRNVRRGGEIGTPPSSMHPQMGSNVPPQNMASSTPRGVVARNNQPNNSTIRGARSGMIGNSQLSEMDPGSVPSQLKKEGDDWFVLYSPSVPRSLDIDLVHTFEHDSVVCCVKFSHDGEMLATGCNHTTQIWDVESGQIISVLIDKSVPKNEDLYIRAVCFSPDDKYLVTGAEDNNIRVWDVQKKTIKHILKGHEQDIYSLDFSPDGKTILSGSGDKTVRLWDLELGEKVHIFSIDDMGPKDAGVTSVAFSPDGRLVAAASLDKMIRIWDAHTGQFLERVDGHKDSVYAVAFSPDGRFLLSGSLDKSLKIWQLNSFPGPSGRPQSRSICMTTLNGHKDFVLSVAYSPDGNWIVSGSKDRCVQFWDPRNAQTQLMLQGHKNSIISVALSPKKPLFSTGSGDCRARIWSYESIQHSQSLN